MRLFRNVIFISFVTALALLYAHQQVELVKLSYSIASKEKRLKDILDHKEKLGYNIENLEAPSRLEQVLLARNMEIAFPRRDHIVTMANLTPKMRAQESVRMAGLERKVNNFFGIFEFFSSRAEAQTREK